MASEKGLVDADMDSIDLAHTNQIAKKAKTADTADVLRVDIEYGSFVSSLQDPIKGILLQASETEGERTGEYDDDINNEYGISSERGSDDVKGRLAVAIESNAISENRVLKKLLQAPRYFDYTESNWLACNGFSEDDDKGKKDAAIKGHKSCYICGDINHSGNRCKKINACSICSEKGHPMKDCPNKNGELDCSPAQCLKCGDADHDMFSCTNNYDTEDLKAINCYICKQAGHLCCAEKGSEGANEASCYRCGEPGHFGKECTKSDVVTFNLLLFCRRCKERGHSRKQCPKKAKAKKGRATRSERRKFYSARKRKNLKQTPAHNGEPEPKPLAVQ